jgi:hypothetical protein
MCQEPATEASEKMITKLTRERRSDPLDDETAQQHSEPVRARIRAHRRYGWPNDEAQKEI